MQNFQDTFETCKQLFINDCTFKEESDYRGRGEMSITV